MSNNDEEFEYLPDDNTEELSNDFEEPDYGNYDYDSTPQPPVDENLVQEEIPENQTQIAQPSQEFNNDTNINSKGKENVIPKKYEGREEYAKTLDNKNYYNDKLAENRSQQKGLQKDFLDAKKDNKEKNDNLEEKKKDTQEKREKLQEARQKKVDNSQDKKNISDRIQNIKSRREGIRNGISNLRDAKKNEKEAANEKKESDKKLEESKNNLKKNRDERKKLLDDKKKASIFKKKHPLLAMKMKAQNALNKLKKVIIIKVLVPVLLIITVFALLINIIYEVFEVVDNVFTEVANIQEKMDNFINGLGFSNSEDAFYDELESLQKQYNYELDVPLLLSTLFYDDIQNNMDPSDVDAKAVTDDDSLISFAAAYNYIKDKIDESNVHVGKDGYKYSSNKIYRLRMLAKHMMVKGGAPQKKTLHKHILDVAARIGEDIKQLFSAGNIIRALLDYLTFGLFEIPGLIEDIAGMLDGSQVFETTDIYNTISHNLGNIFDIFVSLFSLVGDVEDIYLCAGATYSENDKKITYKDDSGNEKTITEDDIKNNSNTTYDPGLICVDVSTYTTSSDDYFKYLKEEYIPKMPEFKKKINSDNEQIKEQEIDGIINGIKEIYKDYKYYFEPETENAEVYYENAVGGIDNVLVRALRKPVDGNFTGFNGRDSFGIYNGKQNNGVVVTHSNSGINEGDSVYSVAKGKIVGIGKATGEVEGDPIETGLSGNFNKYTLTEHELKGLALLCQHEQDSIEGAKAEASLIANKYEYDKSTKSLHEYVRTNPWWNSSSVYLSESDPQPKSEILEGVRDVLVNGNRTLPKYVTEHDDLDSGEIIYIDNGNGQKYEKTSEIKDRSLYIKDVTKIKTTHHSANEYYVFYSFPDSISDPFGYKTHIYNALKDDSASTVENNSNWIKIEHDIVVDGSSYKFTTIYRYLGTIKDGLKVGDTVNKGDVIGTVGKVVDYDEASLYFEFRDQNNTPINPTNLFIPITTDLLVGDSNDVIIANYLLSHGFSKVQTSAILANMYYESHTYNPKDVNEKDCRGISQWCFGRKDNLLKFAESKGQSWDNLDIQLEYLLGELKREGSAVSYTSSYEGVMTEISKYSESQVNDAVYYYCMHFEIPGESSCNGRKNNKVGTSTKGEEWISKIKSAESTGSKITSNGSYIWPAEEANVTDIFGFRYDEYIAHKSSYKSKPTWQHYAIDIGNSYEPYYALCNGYIERVNDSSYHITELNCGTNSNGEEVHLIYEHGDAISGLKKGQQVKTGEKLGTSNGWGPSGSGTYGAHLHFGVYTMKAGKKVWHNPLMYLYGMTYDGKSDSAMSCNIKDHKGGTLTSIKARNFNTAKLNNEEVNFRFRYGSGLQDSSDTSENSKYFYNVISN